MASRPTETQTTAGDAVQAQAGQVVGVATGTIDVVDGCLGVGTEEVEQLIQLLLDMRFAGWKRTGLESHTDEAGRYVASYSFVRVRVLESHAADDLARACETVKGRATVSAFHFEPPV